MTKLSLLAACLTLSTAVACKKTDNDAKVKEMTDKLAAEMKAGMGGLAKPTDPTAAAKPTEPAVPAVAAVPAGPVPSKEKDFLGFELKAFGNWKPTWDADSKVAKWESDDSMTSIWTSITSDDVSTIEKLKEAAPMNSHLGTAITEVVETKTTDRGFWAVVKREDVTEFVDIQKYGDVTVICSAGLSTGPIKQADALQACQSLTLKP